MDETVLIRDLFVECALKVINFNSPATAMSDCCREYAQSGVVMPNGVTTWRCRNHEGMRDFRTGERGLVVYAITRRSNDDI